jgi:hypothetical protein
MQRTFTILAADAEAGLDDRREDQHASRFREEFARTADRGVQARERRLDIGIDGRRFAAFSAVFDPDSGGVVVQPDRS